MKRAPWTILFSLVLVSACGGAAIQPPTSPATQSAPVTEAVATVNPPATPAPGVAALDAQFQGPRGLAFDAAGNLYVTQCEWTYAAIDRINPNGIVTRLAGTGTPGYSGDGGPAISAQLFCPAGVAVGPDGDVYFADHVNNRIRRVDAAGIITTYAGSGPAGLDLGTFSGDGGPATEATLQEPWGVAFDQGGRLYIADRDNVRVRMVDTNGDITTVAGTGVLGSTGDGGPATQAKICPPVGVAINPAGNIIIPDACATTIRMVDGNGVITTIARTDSPDISPDIGSEGNVIVEGDGSMFVQAGPRILRIDSSGVITTVAGNGKRGVPIDGTSAVAAPLPTEIWGMAFDKAGNLYVADGATSVYRVDARGIVNRYAGKP